ncbi:AAA family ATPase [Desulfosarcina cetonica]|uniref:AAA family ATPase n=1 Tax=Desulfosarcina cetonica TaxID=90730 RepID=UPI001FEF81D0|nr:AAA family ATPase [Desulfosarcina cetonica]
MEYDLELDTDGLANYLANHPDIKGIGPAKARLIAQRFGRDFDRAISEEPEAVAQAAGLRIEAIHRLRTEWRKTRQTNKAITWLAAYGLTHYQVTSLVKKFGNDVLGLLKADPYIIVREVRGFGFKRVDKIARKMGTDKDDPARIRAGITHCVSTALEQGDCWIEYEELIDQANMLLVMDVLDSRDRIEKTLSTLIDEGALSCAAHGGRFLVARPDIRKMEDDLAGTLRKGGVANPHIPERCDLPGLVDRIVPTLNEGQRIAVLAAISKSITLITGGAGSGKTFTVSAITDIYDELDLHVTLTAPTGKAAKRLEEVVNRGASTIHRLLGFNGQDFARGPEDPLDTDVVVVDEVSMVDIPLAWQLFRCIDLARTAVVLVGDHNQLPPVGPGNLLRDLVQTRAVPTVVLDKVVRQAAFSRRTAPPCCGARCTKPAKPKPRVDGRGTWSTSSPTSGMRNGFFSKCSRTSCTSALLRPRERRPGPDADT